MNRHIPVCRQRGLSLIELLVTTLVLSFGLLGASGLLVKGISNAAGMEVQSRATQAAHEIIDAMRANPRQANDYAVSWATDPQHIAGTSLARRDVKRWLQTLRSLPGGDGQIQRVGASTQFTVSVRFTTCMGTLSNTEREDCNKADKQVRDFSFKL